MKPFEETEGEEKRDSDAEYRQRILAAAARLLDRKGIDSVNMYQIAQEAGIGQGTLYRRYNHPGEIYATLLLTSTEQFLDELEAQQKKADSSTSALDRLYAVIAQLFDYIERNSELLFTISCMFAGKKNFLPYKRPITIRLQNLLHTCLSQAAERGETRDIDLILTGNFLLSTLSPEQYAHHRDTLGYTKEQYLAGIRQLFIEGIRA